MQRHVLSRAGGDAVTVESARTDAREGWRFLIRSIEGNWTVLAASFGAALTWTAAVVSVPLLLGAAVNAGIVGHNERRLVFLAIAIALIGVVQAGASGIRRFTNGLASRRLEADLRRRYFAKLLRLEVAYHDQVNRGQLLSRVTSDLFQIQAFVSSSPAWSANVVAVLAVAVVLLVLQPVLGAVALVGLPFVAAGSKKFAARIRPSLTLLQRERGDLAGVVEETVSGIRAVKGFGAEPILDVRLGEQADRVRDQALEVVRLRARFVPFVSTIPLLELVAVNWLGGTMVLHHHLSVGTLLSFNAYIGLIAPPVQSIGGYIVLAQRAIVSSRRIHTVMRRAPAIAEPSAPVPLPAAGGGEIRVEGLSFAYPSAAGPATRDVDLTVERGEVLAVVGPTGSGKSTLLALISRLYDPTEGRVLVDGVDVREVSLADLRSAIAVVFEENFLFEDSVRANLCLGRTDVTDEELRRCLRLSRAEEFVENLPDGLDTMVGERGLSLSGGQRQRLALARALLGEPRVLMLDDATSAIDAANEQAIVASLARARRGRTTILVSHRPATIASADRVVLIDEGRVVASGTHDELLASCPRYREVLGSELPSAAPGPSPTAGVGQ